MATILPFAPRGAAWRPWCAACRCWWGIDNVRAVEDFKACPHCGQLLTARPLPAAEARMPAPLRLAPYGGAATRLDYVDELAPAPTAEQLELLADFAAVRSLINNEEGDQ